MARKKKVNKDIEQYDHASKKRLNNPPVGWYLKTLNHTKNPGRLEQPADRRQFFAGD